MYALHLLEHRDDPSAEVDAAMADLERAEAINPGFVGLRIERAKVENLEARLLFSLALASTGYDGFPIGREGLFGRTSLNRPTTGRGKKAGSGRILGFSCRQARLSALAVSVWV